MRARNIKPGFFRNEQLLQVPPLGRLLFAGLWCLADREGRLLDRPAQIKWDVLPADDCDVNALLAELAMRGFIRRYTVDGTRYIEVTRFLAHQRPHYKEKAGIIPPPSDTTPVQKHDSTRSDSLIPDSLIPDSLIPSAVSQLDGDRCTVSAALSDTQKIDMTGDAPCSASLQQHHSSAKAVDMTGDASCSTARQFSSAKAVDMTGDASCSASRQLSSAKAVDMTGDASCSASLRQLSSAKAVDMTGDTPCSAARQLSSAKAVDMTGDASCSASRQLSSAKDTKTTDRKANIFFSRQDGNTNRSTPCKQVSHGASWVEGFFGAD